MKALVTGGGGFLGGAIVRLLRERGDQVWSFSRGEHPELARLGVEQVQGDLTDRKAVAKAVAGCDTVFHVAAKAGIWGRYRDFHDANITGTENIVAACREHRIPRLIYTSSPSVVFDGTDVQGANESLPYPDHYEAFYPQTKAAAERLVLAANSSDLATVALRPHLIWGPGDNHLVPRILSRGRAGKLRRIGTRTCLVDTVYVDNAAAAHLSAADRLSPGTGISGKAYFITNGEPVPLWEMVNRILAAGNLPPVTRTVSPGVAYAAGLLCEKLWTLLPLPGEPPMTRFVARELATHHWFNISAATNDLGYRPAISVAEGLERLARSLAKR